MALKSINQNPTIADTIRFDILTPGVNGCLPNDVYNNTYLVNQVTIYFVERDFTIPDSQEIEYNFPHPNSALEAAAARAQLIACQNPTPANLASATLAQAYATAALTTTPFYYKDVDPVAVFGTPDYPAWLRTTPEDSILQQYIDSNGSPVPGHFILDWFPENGQEGDYFICWSWTPLPAGDQLSAHQPFYLVGNNSITTAIPTNATKPGKYVTLLENYLPEIFKSYLVRNDLTPEVLEKFHAALALGFTDIENLANQIIDLLDANVVQEAILPYLSNLFNLKLKSNDPTLWRRQVKNAVPFFMQKGTLKGLTNALSQAAITLNKYTSLWQVTSPYTYTDMFYVTDPTSLTFVLTYGLVSLDDNFVLQYLPTGTTTYLTLSNNYVNITTNNGETTISWLGQIQNPRYILHAGDLIVVKYLIQRMPSGWQSNENYLQSLDLADQRNAVDVNSNLVVPLKNWNVHLIKEDDPLFSVLIPIKQPYQDPVIFGKVRTEFAYSENIYNMDTYNGSLRDSTEPCDIDAGFLDDCGSCSSSKFILDVELQELSNDKIQETMDVVNEFVPFHSVLHQLNISGGINEFILPPVEWIEILLAFNVEDNILSGNANDTFTRWHYDDYTLNGIPWSELKRNVLADTNTVINSATAIAYNSFISLYCPDIQFNSLPISNQTLLEVLAPSPNSGSYSVSYPTKNTVRVENVFEPLNQSSFTFRLSNLIYSNPSSNISQSDYFELSDNNLNFDDLTLVTLWDLANENNVSGNAWKVVTTYGNVTIADISPDGNLVLNDPTNLLPTNGVNNVTYTIETDLDAVIASSISGTIICRRRGIVAMPDVNVSNINTLVQIGFYLSYSGNQYLISGFVPNTINSVYIDGYTSGNAGGVPVSIYHRRADNQIGYFNYMGIQMDAGYNLESALDIQNGSNPPVTVLDNNQFKENFLILIGDSYYQIEQINDNILTLSGPFVDYTTLNFGGTDITYSVIQLINQPVDINGNYFDFIDRRGVDLAFISVEQEPVLAMGSTKVSLPKMDIPIEVPLVVDDPIPLVTMAAKVLNSQNDPIDKISQTDTVCFVIEYLDGSKEKRNL